MCTEEVIINTVLTKILVKESLILNDEPFFIDATFIHTL